jgi:hypothetical protein
MWVYGCNTPGYLPDEPYAEAATWVQARDALLWDVERADEGAWSASMDQIDAAEAALRDAAEGKPFAIPCGSFVLCVEEAI